MHLAPRVEPDMNVAVSFVGYCVSSLSCPTYRVLPTMDLFFVTQTFAHCFRTRGYRNVPLCLLKLLLAVETEPIVRPGEAFSVPCLFPV